MKPDHQLVPRCRTTSSHKSHRKRILPSSHHHSTSSIEDSSCSNNNKKSLSLLRPGSPSLSLPRFAAAGFSSILSSPLSAISTRWLGIPSAAAAITPSLGRRVTGTLFGRRRGHVTFAVQDHPRSEPALLLELATSTSALVKDMASGLMRIALECDKTPRALAESEGRRGPKLIHEPAWTMYCNGRKCGHALSRSCGESDWHMLSRVENVSVGAGVIPMGGATVKGGGEGELLYMRARFERVVGSRDSEAFYMVNPDGNGGPELSIFLLRV